MKNTLLFNMTHLFALLIAAGAPLAEGKEFECGGMSTIIHSGEKYLYAICHSYHDKIRRTSLTSWQQCLDALIYVRDRSSGKNVPLTDCSPLLKKEFKIRNDTLFIKHYFQTNSDDSTGPVLIENIDLNNNLSDFELLREFPAYTESQARQAATDIEDILKRPFDGNTYFDVVYRSLYLIRDYANTDPEYSYSVFSDYRTRGVFDGEVAETLGLLEEDVQLIRRSRIKQTGTAEHPLPGLKNSP